MTSRRRTDRGQVTATLVSALIVIVAAVGGSLLLWSVRGQLPEVVATHWGPDGNADAFRPVAELYVQNAVVVGVLPLFLLVIGLVTRQGRVMGPISAATAVFMSVVMNGSLWLQRGMAAEQVPDASFDLAMVVASIAAAAVGVLGWLVFRRPRSEAPVPLNIASNAPRLLVDEAVTLAWTGRTRLAPAAIVVLGIGTLATVIPVPLMVASGNWGSAIVMALLAVVIAVLGLAMAANVAVDARGVRARALGFIPWADVPMQTIAGATVKNVNPLGDFGGWGLRAGFNGERGLITSGGPALRIDRGDQGPFLITLSDAEAAAATLNTLLARREGHDERQ